MQWGGGGEGKSGGADDSLSGVWKVDKSRLDKPSLERYLAATRVPIVFRGEYGVWLVYYRVCYSVRYK